MQKDPHPGKIGQPVTVVSPYQYAQNNPANLVDPDGQFGFLIALLFGAIFSAGVSAIQAGIQTAIHGGNFWDNFAKNFAINFAFTFLGLGIAALQGVGEFSLGWGGVYTTETSGRGISLGFFQSSPGSGIGTSLYWHEVGHTVNWTIAGALTGPEWRDKLGFLGGWFVLHGLGSLGGAGNVFTAASEGSADVWSSPWYNFEQSSGYRGPLGTFNW